MMEEKVCYYGFWVWVLCLSIILGSCGQVNVAKYKDDKFLVIDEGDYKNRMAGFWLGSCIANWTGLVTEMDKIGNIGEIQTGAFYTSSDWGGDDLPNIWSGDAPSDLSATIDFVLRDTGEVWGADDDTDIEYMYQELMLTNKTALLTADQIRSGWLKHIKSDEENYLWVANQRAFDLMEEGLLPPATGDPENNEHFEMIDAQLTTEIFGLFAPERPDWALKLADLPIKTVARKEAEEIAQFYVVMYALAFQGSMTGDLGESIRSMANEARDHLDNDEYPAKMYDFVLNMYEQGAPWEETRDSVYQRYQVKALDGYDITGQNLYCNGCFAAGINYASSLISLFYGGGDYKETVKIGTLAGWDSDNPTATWGGMLGFMMGYNALQATFGGSLSNQFDIHRTRQNFENGVDNFENMARKGWEVLKMVVNEFGGKVEDGRVVVPLG